MLSSQGPSARIHAGRVYIGFNALSQNNITGVRYVLQFLLKSLDWLMNSSAVALQQGGSPFPWWHKSSPCTPCTKRLPPLCQLALKDEESTFYDEWLETGCGFYPCRPLLPDAKDAVKEANTQLLKIHVICTAATRFDFGLAFNYCRLRLQRPLCLQAQFCTLDSLRIPIHMCQYIS